MTAKESPTTRTPRTRRYWTRGGAVGVAALALAVLLAACDEEDDPPAAPSASARPTQAALPGDIAEAIDAALDGDGARLDELRATTEGPCVVDPAPAIRRPPPCPDGVSEGTLVPALVFGACPDEGVQFVEASSSLGGGIFQDHVIGVVELGDGPMRYAALIGFEKTA
jgi:hypothetical protein